MSMLILEAREYHPGMPSFSIQITDVVLVRHNDTKTFDVVKNKFGGLFYNLPIDMLFDMITSPHMLDQFTLEGMVRPSLTRDETTTTTRKLEPEL